MANERDRADDADTFDTMSEADRRAALDVFGRMLIEARDRAILQWEQILGGTRKYAPWDRVLQKFPRLDEHCRAAMNEVLPHMVDTFMYCLLAGLDASDTVQVSVASGGKAIANVAGLSWGFPAEPGGQGGWLARFSKRRFEQPY